MVAFPELNDFVGAQPFEDRQVTAAFVTLCSTKAEARCRRKIVLFFQKANPRHTDNVMTRILCQLLRNSWYSKFHAGIYALFA
jgi:hypothetical protein